MLKSKIKRLLSSVLSVKTKEQKFYFTDACIFIAIKQYILTLKKGLCSNLSKFKTKNSIKLWFLYTLLQVIREDTSTSALCSGPFPLEGVYG